MLLLISVASGCASPAPTIEKGLTVFYGNLHAHTAFSDGIGSPEEAIAYARDTAKLDFIALTDHDYLLDSSKYASIVLLAGKHSNDTFVVIPGFEWSSLPFGHLLVLGGRELTDIRRTPTLADLIGFARAREALLVIAHPGLTSRPDAVFRYVEGNDVIKAIEIGNGYDMEGYKYRRFDIQVLEALRRGWQLGLVLGQDNHHGRWGDAPNGGWVAAVASTLNRAQIVHALKHGHTFATEDREVHLLFTANGRLMGSTVENASTLHFEIRVQHPLLSEARISLYEDTYEKPIAAFRSVGRALIESFLYKPDSHGHHYFVRVDFPNGKLAWSSPIYRRVAHDVRAIAAWTEPSMPIIGQKFRVIGKLYNAGSAGASGIRYRFYHLEDSSVVSEGSVDLRPGEVKEVETLYTAPPTEIGGHSGFRFTFIAPPGDYVGDNVAQAKITYCAQTGILNSTITVTRDFGHVELARIQTRLSGCPTALEVLEKQLPVEYVAGLLYGINGVGSARENAARTLYWCFAVNRKKAAEGIGTYRLKENEDLEFDLHRSEAEDWSKNSCTARKTEAGDPQLIGH